MRRYIIFLFLAIAPLFLTSQSTEDTISSEVKNIKFDMLKSPTNPAFLMMNTSPTEIVEPGSTPEFISSLQNASNKFTAIPNNYGFAVTPFWWGKKAKKLSFEKDFNSDENEFTLYRTLSISGGVVQVIEQGDALWRYGFGVQTTLLRGKIDKSKKNSYLEKLREYHKQYYGDINKYYAKNPEYNTLESERIKINLQFKLIDEEKDSGIISSDSATKQKLELVPKLKLVQNELDLVKSKLSDKFDEERKYLESNKELDKKFNEMNERVGLKWDVGGGFSIKSTNNNIDSTGLYRAGIWSNLGGNFITSDSTSSNLAGFLLLRYLYFNEIYYLIEERAQLLENLHTIDFGAKLQYEVLGKFIIGIELIYRTSLSNSIYENNYKLNSMIQYSFGNNKMVYASIGNNFNDDTNADPNKLILVIGLNIGFGGNIDLYDVGL